MYINIFIYIYICRPTTSYICRRGKNLLFRSISKWMIFFWCVCTSWFIYDIQWLSRSLSFFIALPRVNQYQFYFYFPFFSLKNSDREKTKKIETNLIYLGVHVHTFIHQQILDKLLFRILCMQPNIFIFLFMNSLCDLFVVIMMF